MVVVNAQHTHKACSGVRGWGWGFRGGVNIVHSPPSTPTVVGTSGHWSVTGFGRKRWFQVQGEKIWREATEGARWFQRGH